jgi:transglutaminase-like putative cysteine protease
MRYLPFAYQEPEARALTPYIDTAPALHLPFGQPSTEPQPTVKTLVALNEALHDNISYERREEGPARSAAETLQLGRAACRDYAVLLVSVLRGLGLAARHASGYLCEFGDEERRAEGALHAWVETYLPGAGWVGMDPTNGTFCDHHHLVAAVGVDPADVSPVEGRFYSKERVAHRLDAALVIIPHAAR